MKRKNTMSAKTLACCALLAALSIVFARLIGLMPAESARYSIEAVPIFISGMLFGPLAGGLVGFSADFVGCLFSPYGFNPIFCIPPILYGVSGGVFRAVLGKKVSIPRLIAGFSIPVVFGSILYQSAALAFVYYGSTFAEAFLLKLSTRSVQFAVTMAVDVVVVYLLFRAKVFDRLQLWPPKK